MLCFYLFVILLKYSSINKFGFLQIFSCKLNLYVVIQFILFQFHLEYVCEDRGKIDNFVSFNTDEVENIIEPPKVEIFEDGGENWDDVSMFY